MFHRKCYFLINAILRRSLRLVLIKEWSFINSEIHSESPHMEVQIQNLEKEIVLIKQRNSRVEADKAWETSYFRVLLISTIIYVIAVKVMYFIGTGNYYLNALIPAIGYFISVQSLPFIKKWWIKNNF
jgi:hypothetical protein